MNVFYPNQPKGKCLNCKRSIFLFIETNKRYRSRNASPRQFCNRICYVAYVKKRHSASIMKKKKDYTYSEHRDFMEIIQKQELEMKRIMGTRALI